MFLALGACAQSEPATALEAPTVVYHPAGRMLPFPSDRYLKEDVDPQDDWEQATGYRLDVSAFRASDPILRTVDGIEEGLGALDGFGTSADIAIEFTATPELGSLTDEFRAFEDSIADQSPIHLISIDPTDPEAGKPVPFVAREIADGNTVFLTPWRPLRPAGWYAVIVRPGLKDVVGRPFTAPEAFRADYASGRGEGLEGAGYARLREVVATTPLFAVTFRTASVTPFLEELLADIRDDAPAPFTWTTVAPGAGHPELKWIVEGEFLRRDFRDARGKLHRAEQGNEWTKFTVTVPLTTATRREPFGLVLGQHGLGDRRQAVQRMADGLATYGLATVAIDAPEHGSRNTVESELIASLETRLGLWTENGRLKMEPWKFRDIIRQQVIDHQQILRVMRNFDVDLGQDPGTDIDADRVAYSGQSMGGIMGGVSGAMNTELLRVLLNVPGGRIINIFTRNELLGQTGLMLLKPPTFSEADMWRLLAMFQAVVDPGDPINYVARIQLAPPAGDEPRPLLIQGAFKDVTLANHTTFDLARAARAPYTGPWKGSLADLPEIAVPENGIDADAPAAFSLYEEVIVRGKLETAGHGNLWASDTAIEQAGPFLAHGIILPPVVP